MEQAQRKTISYALENSLEFDVLGFLDDNDLLVGKFY